MRGLERFLLSSLILLAATGCSGSKKSSADDDPGQVGDRCRTDEDCAGDLVCRGTYCFEPREVPEPDAAGEVEPDAESLAEPDGPAEDERGTTLPPVSATEPLQLDSEGTGDDQGHSPSVFAVGDRAFLFYNEASANDGHGALFLRTADWGASDFGAPVPVTNLGTWVDLHVQADGLLALVAVNTATHLREAGLDGADWPWSRTFSGGDGTCPGGMPSRFVDGSTAPLLIAAGYDHNTGIFGCVERTDVHVHPEDAGRTATRIEGTTSGAFAFGDRIVLVSSRAVLTSDDGGVSFDEVPDGDTTADQIRGTGAVRIGDDLLLVQDYNYASQDSLAVLRSRDRGATWGEKQVLRTTPHWIGMGALASDGNSVFLAWLECPDGRILGSYHHREAFVSHSPDGGLTWSAPARVSTTTDQQNIAALGLAVRGAQAAVAYAVTGEGLSYEHQGVFVVWAEPDR